MDYTGFKVPSRMEGLAVPTVWREFTPLAVEHNAYNLGQGFPDWPCPQFCKDAIKRAVDENFNQYGRPAGHPSLVNVLADHYSPLLGRKIDPTTEITTSVGATEGLYAIWQVLLNDGDEVILFEPVFDVYKPQIKMAGGNVKYIKLSPNSDGKWTFSVSELENAITPNTKAILLNTPHNPTGKVFTVEEIELIRDVMYRHKGIMLVTDEVYEKIIFDGKRHVYPASIEGMWDRTITVSSQGKTFSTTGWKLGWVIGPRELVSRVVFANQNIYYCFSTFIQEALSEILLKAMDPYEGFPSYFDYISNLYQKKRDKLVDGLRAAGMEPFVPEGGIFVVANTSRVPQFSGEPEADYMKQSTPACPVMTRDWAFCRWLTIEKKVCAIPFSAFYEKESKHIAANFARFALCKEDDTIDCAMEILMEMKNN